MTGIRHLLPSLALLIAAQAAAFPLAGDCNGDGRVTVDELVLLVNIDLGFADVSVCPQRPCGSLKTDIVCILSAANSLLYAPTAEQCGLGCDQGCSASVLCPCTGTCVEVFGCGQLLSMCQNTPEQFNTCLAVLCPRGGRQ